MKKAPPGGSRHGSTDGVARRVVYRAPRNGGRFYLVTPAGTRYDLGPAGDNDTVVVHGSSFFLLSGGSAYRLSP